MRVPKVSTTSSQDTSSQDTTSNQGTIKEATTATTNTPTTTTTAPKTGENAGIYVAELLALVSAAGIGVYAKRKKVVR